MKDMKPLFYTPAIAVIAFAAISCDDSLGAIDQGSLSKVEITIESDEDINPEELENASYSFNNISSGTTSKFSPGEDIWLLPGLYDISFSAQKTLPNGVISEVRATKQSVVINGELTSVTMTAYNNIPTDDFIISEVFFTGTLQASGNQYYGDDYVKIYNNTDHVLYADGITLFESKFTTTQKFDYTPDIMGEAMTVQALYTIPGDGTEHPVMPGEYVLLADTGIDHRVINPNSFDLSDADWEWYDVSTKPNNLDIDSPTVPNLDKWYCYTLSFWILHNRGFKAYGIARIPIDKDEYLSDYWYTYDYTMVLEAGTFPMSQSAYRLPNEWIVDVVNCSVEASRVWNVSDPSLDMGWTHCGTIDHDKTRYFHAVRRKLLYINEQGNPVFQDTNNSSEDFNPYVTPSEIELQGTAVNSQGDLCTTLTYDGVTPIETGSEPQK